MPKVAAKKAHFRGGLYARQDPYLWIVGLAMVSSSILFIFLLGMLLVRKATVGVAPLPLPSFFYLSTGVLLFSSGTLAYAQQLFEREQYKAHTNWGLVTISLGLVFVVLQLGGWGQLYAAGHLLQSHDSSAYIYLLSGLHILHIVLALIMLSWAMTDSLQSKTYVDGFLQGLNPAKRTRMRLAQWLWHFADGLWVALFLVLSLLLEY
jgi:cytochrome c oxidase subunit 3